MTRPLLNPLTFSRRDLLVTAGGLVAASAVGADRSSSSVDERRKIAFARVDQALMRAVDDQLVPGIVAMAATDQGIFYQGNFGRHEIGAGRAMTADTVFWIASMTKAVTATAAMQLVERGKLSLEAPIGKVLPDLDTIQVLEGFDASGAPKLRTAKRPITLRHLLTHTAGFAYDTWNADLRRYLKATHTPSIGECKNAAFNAPLMFDPGDRWEYGTSMDWVGKVVEAVCDQSLEVYFREHIFEPLGMNDSGFLIGSAQRARTAMLYVRNHAGSLDATPFEMPQRPEFFMGGGGLYSTPRDYIAFLQMHLRDGEFNGVQVLKSDTVALMRRNHIGDLNVTTLKSQQPDVSNDVNLFPGMIQKWGLSFDINTEAGSAGRSAGSLSWAGLLNTYFWIDPAKRITGTIMTQLLPFADLTVLKLYAAFERGMYDALGQPPARSNQPSIFRTESP